MMLLGAVAKLPSPSTGRGFRHPARVTESIRR